MPTPTFPLLGASTVARKRIYEVNTGTAASPTWVMIGGVKSSTPNIDQANWVDDSDYSSAGYGSQTKTASTWSVTMTLKRAPVSGTVTYDVAQEYLRAHAIGNFGPANTVQIRWYEYDPNDPNGTSNPRVEAYMGFVGVEWADQGGDDKAVEEAQVTMNGQGKLNLIAHPYPVTPFVPVIDSATPLALLAAGGQVVHIYGRGFTGTVATTGVKFAGTNSPSWTVDSDSLIVAVSPAHTAGSGPILVTNATGPSTTGPTVVYS